MQGKEKRTIYSRSQTSLLPSHHDDAQLNIVYCIEGANGAIFYFNGKTNFTRVYELPYQVCLCLSLEH